VVRALVPGVTISNGLAWSADGSVMYYVDTPTRRIDAFDYDSVTGDVSGRRPVVTIPESDGSPDGMTIDAEGGLWVALWGGGAVHRYCDGRLDEVVEVPAPLVTCPAFAGPDGGTLVITTAAIGLDGPGPESGAVYALRPGVTGRPEPMVRV
jgi:sugar lactone lactonase YvrE